MIKESDIRILMGGGRFNPIADNELLLPSVRMQNSEISEKTQKVSEKVDQNRKYDSKIRDGEVDVIKEIYTGIIKESQFEHRKNIRDKVDDIFRHTDSKVSEVTQKLLQTYNRKQSNRIDIETDNDI